MSESLWLASLRGSPEATGTKLESLILAQNERWRRA